jgi:AraC-like DNA-binding protein
VNVNRLKYDQSRESLLVCSNSGLLFGTLDTMTNQFHCEQYFELGPVHDAYIRDTNQLFVATQNNGILLYDLNPGEKIYSFNKQNHLSHNYCHNILEDQSGRIWASSNNGLYCIDIDQGWVQELNSTDGLVNDEFNRLASAKGPNGLLAFGGINGVSILDPTHFNFTKDRKAVEVTGLQTQSNGEEATHIYEPQAVSDRIAAFKIPNHIRSIRPLFPFAVLQSDLKLYYRVKEKDAFWKRAKHSHIPTSSIDENDIIELLWTANHEGYHSEIEIIKSSNTSLQTQVYTFLLLAVLGFFVINRLTESRNRTIRSQQSELHQASTSSQTHSDAQEPAPSPLQDYLNSLIAHEKRGLNRDPSFKDPFIQEMNELIHKHINSAQLSVSFLANHFNLSTRQFHRRVLDHTNGLTPGKYIGLIRLIKAKEMIMKDFNLRISEISENVGYRHASYLTAKFKDFYGLTPKEFQTKIKSLRRQS